MDTWRPQPVLRQKKPFAADSTDRQIFESLKLGDPWPDAGLPDAYWYIRKSSRAAIPDSWLDAFEAFDAELRVIAPSK